jgi:23S rRNA pseudouridine2604 synthase
MRNPENSTSTSLNKFIAESGMCSRREADVLIKAGKVLINGAVAKGGNRVEEGDEVVVDGKPIGEQEEKVYLAYHKPVGITCTGDKNDPDNIIGYINYPKRIFYVGRLDKMSEGLILMTNDGDIVNKILRSENTPEKEDIVSVSTPITPEFIKAMRAGVHLPDLEKTTKKCFVQKMDDYRFRIILTQGLNRQIRRMCEALDYHASRLIRVRVMHINIGKLKVGELRKLNRKEERELFETIKDSNPDFRGSKEPES